VGLSAAETLKNVVGLDRKYTTWAPDACSCDAIVAASPAFALFGIRLL